MGENLPRTITSGWYGQNNGVFNFGNGLAPIASGREVGMTVAYVNRAWDGSQVTSATATAPEALRHFPSMVTGEHWYAVCENLTLNDRVAIPSGAVVNLVLMDGVTVNCTKGMRLPASSTLIIWGQAGDSGSLRCDANDVDDCAGIGGNDEEDAGKFILNGGSVTALGGKFAAGDGGGSDGTVRVYETAMVSTGADKDHLSPVASGQRNGACQSGVCAQIEPCPHTDALVVDSGWDKHLVCCSWRVGTNQTVEQAHTFDADTHMCVCGHEAYLVSMHAVGGCSAEAVDPLTLEQVERISGGAALWLYIYPDLSGRYPDEVSAGYVLAGTSFTLDPGRPIQEDGRRKYAIPEMPNADVVITVGSGIRTWDDLQAAIDQAEAGDVLQITADLTAGAGDTALYVASQRTLTIDLNGLIDRGLVSGAGRTAEDSGSVFRVEGDLTVCDSVGGGRITVGSDPDGAGGVDLSGNGVLTLLGGRITGNRAGGDDMAGGVCVPDGTSLKVGGSASIEGNDGPNVLLAGDGAVVEVVQPLAEGARFGVTVRNMSTGEGAHRTVTAGLPGRGELSAFFSDDGGYLILPDVNGEAALWCGYPTVTFDANEGSGIMAQESVPTGTLFALPQCGFAAPFGHVFAAWSVGGEILLPTEDFLVTENVTAAALWQSMAVSALPDDLTSIEAEAFEGTAATIVDIPAGCASIGDRAFCNCRGLTQIRIPAGCALGEDVFDGCGPVYVFGATGSPAELYCMNHANCAFVAAD